MTNTPDTTKAQPKLKRIPTPSEIKEYMDQYVVGQEEAKKTLAVAVYNHLKRIQYKAMGQPFPLAKSNVLLLGETGCGKTLLVKTIAKFLNVPCYIQDCTKITASGYVGSDVEDCIVGLLRNTNYDVARAQKGIVMLDEVDKIRSANAGPSIMRDVSGQDVQQSLLKIMEGDIVGCPPFGGRKHPEQPLIYVNTEDVLFIASGAFVGLEDIISKRIGKGKGRVGFKREDTDLVSNENIADNTTLLSKLAPQDLKDYGMIPEFIGRLPVTTYVEPLSKDTLIKILTEPADSLVGQYTRLLEMDGVKLLFTVNALDAIADKAIELGTGARGLRSIMEAVMRDIMFEAPSLRKPRGKEKEILVSSMTVKDKIAKMGFKNAS